MGVKMIYRVPDEIVRKLNKMEPNKLAYKNLNFSINLQLDSSQMLQFLNEAFESGYEQAVKEMKRFFDIKQVNHEHIWTNKNSFI